MLMSKTHNLYCRYILKRNRFFHLVQTSLPILSPTHYLHKSDIYTSSVKLKFNSIKPLIIQEVPPSMSRKNYFLNLSRTGGESVNCFRLPSQRGLAHHSRSINPVYKLLAQEIKFLLEHNRETHFEISSHPNTKNIAPQGLYKQKIPLLINTLQFSV